MGKEYAAVSLKKRYPITYEFYLAKKDTVVLSMDELECLVKSTYNLGKSDAVNGVDDCPHITFKQ